VSKQETTRYSGLARVVRYVRLYGIRRTLVKVRGRRHMSRSYGSLPPNDRRARSAQSVGIIGCGNFAYSTIAYFLARRRGRVLRGVMDVDPNRAASLFDDYGAAYYTEDASRVIDDPDIRIVYIASNHASHADYAIRALDAGKSVHIEKPHVVSHNQLSRLIESMRRSEGMVFLGFNRPMSRFGGIIRSYLAAETGPGMYNWFVVGHRLGPDHWYRNPDEGGRILGNFCHWTDFILDIAPSDAGPIEINPSRADEADSDVSVSYRFGDGTIAVITFSAKEEPFEGIREHFTAHKGRCYLTMEDFQRLTVDVGPKKRVYRSRRDQGHEAAIIAAYDTVGGLLAYDRAAKLEYVRRTAELFLATRDALERNSRVILG